MATPKGTNTDQTLLKENREYFLVPKDLPCFQNSVINWENPIKIRRVGGNASNQETPRQVGKVGMSVNITEANENWK